MSQGFQGGQWGPGGPPQQGGNQYPSGQPQGGFGQGFNQGGFNQGGFGQGGFGQGGFGSNFGQSGWGAPQGQPQAPWGRQPGPQQFGPYQPGMQPGGPGMTQAQWPGAQPPAPPKKGGLRPVLLGAAAVVALAIVGLIAYSMLQPSYENDDYQPPAPGPVKPMPEIEETDIPAIYESNKLYQQRIASPTRCEMNPKTLDVDSASDAEVKSYINDLMACNLRVWDPAFQGTKSYEQVRPVVNIYHDKVSTPCGGGKQMGPNAMYCGANQQIYYSRQLHTSHPALAAAANPHAIDLIVSHEYGHAIQGRTAMLVGAKYAETTVSKSEALELNRRIETQADCFSGMTLGSIAQSAGYTNQTWQGISAASRAVGDDQLSGKPNIEGDHGLAASREFWFQTGVTAGGSVGRCNTYKAPANQVR